MLAALLACQPDFYGTAVASTDDGRDVEARARRMVTKASALHAAITRPSGGDGVDASHGRWEASIRADELNAWLATDLPRSHANWLPGGVSAPRIAFQPRHAKVGVRVAVGPLSAVAWADFEIVLRDLNQFAITIERARVGAIPLPRAAILRELAMRLGRLGMMTDLRRLDDRLVLVATVAGATATAEASVRVESLSLVAGELLVAGTGPSRSTSRPGGAGPAP